MDVDQSCPSLIHVEILGGRGSPSKQTIHLKEFVDVPPRRPLLTCQNRTLLRCASRAYSNVAAGSTHDSAVTSAIMNRKKAMYPRTDSSPLGGGGGVRRRRGERDCEVRQRDIPSIRAGGGPVWEIGLKPAGPLSARIPASLVSIP